MRLGGQFRCFGFAIFSKCLTLSNGRVSQLLSTLCCILGYGTSMRRIDEGSDEDRGQAQHR